MTEYYYLRPEVLDLIPKDRHTVIEASAGTGKTYTIEHLFVELVLEAGLPVESILVLTYTERAAGELRNRIRSILEKVLSCKTEITSGTYSCWRLDETKKIALSQALFAFDRAPIHTIHSFFQRVITENAFSSGRLLQQKLVDAKSAFSKAFMQAIRRGLIADDVSRAFVSCWLVSYGDIGQLEKFLYNCHAKKSLLSPVLDPQLLSERAEVIKQLLSDADSIESYFEELRKLKIHASTRKAMKERLAWLRDMLETRSTGAAIPELLSSMEQKYNNKTVGEYFETIRADLQAKAGDSPVTAVIFTFLDALVPFKAGIAQTCLRRVKDFLSDEKSRRGLYDFDDMILYLREALEGPGAATLLSLLRSRFSYALIDESQDTDDLQWQIFRKIFRESRADNIIYLIGDPKQSIYGFRGADVRTYLAAKEEIASISPPVTLSMNFRSTGKLISAYNAIFDQAAAAPFFDGMIKYDSPVSCGLADLVVRDDKGAELLPVEIWELEPGDSDKISAPQYRTLLGKQIAQEIRGILEGRLLFGRKGEERPVRANDIFILTRKESEGRDVARYLKDAGIPHAFYKQDGLFQTPEAKDVRDLLRAVDRPHDQSRRFMAWLTPFFSIGLEQLASCRELDDAHPLLRRLHEWRQLAMKRSYQLLFRRITDDSGLIRRELFTGRTERRLTNYLHIFEILIEEASAASYDLSELLLLLEGFIKETASPSRDEGNVQRLETDKDAVQIMTMHKSKGLEAAVVFIYGGMTGYNNNEFHAYRDEQGRMTFIGNPPAKIKTISERDSREEDQRLLYVAVTRAKARLYLPYVSPDYLSSKMTGGTYAQLNSRIGAMTDSMQIDGDGQLFRIRKISKKRYAEASTEDEVNRPGLIQDAQLTELIHEDRASYFESLRAGHAGFVITSYSMMKHAGSASVSLPDDHDITDRAIDVSQKQEGDMDLPSGAQFGSCIHAIMERISFEAISAAADVDTWCAGEAVSGVFRGMFALYGIDLKYVPAGSRLVYRTMKTRIRFTDGEILKNGLSDLRNYARETEFLYPYPEAWHPGIGELQEGKIEIGRGFIKGFIDLLFEYNGRTCFADWKTDLLADYSEPALQEHFDKNYLLQSKLYSLAVVKMLGIRTKADYDAKFGGMLYLFMRGMAAADGGGSGLLCHRPEWEDIAACETELLTGTLSGTAEE